MATQDELAQALNDLTATVTKIGTETKALIDNVATLTTELNNAGTVSPAVQTALDALTARVNIVDGLVPDAPTGS